MYRHTYVEVNLKNIKYNIKKIIEVYSDYKYYIGIIKANGYGHNNGVIKTILEAGCNYLAVATLDEALQVRKIVKNIPILCLGIINGEDIYECIKNNITITISNEEQLNSIIKVKHDNLKIHLKVNSGMNRLGVSTKNNFNKMYKTIRENNLILEGLFTHIHSPLNKKITLKQYKKFKEIISDIDISSIPIIHVSNSEATLCYEKLDIANGCRLGIAMYGLMQNKKLKLLSTFSLYSEVIQINEVENDTIGYEGAYKVKGKEKIAVIPIGFADGIIRKNSGRKVYINDKKYKIVGNICMDMLFVKVDKTVKTKDKVTIIKDIEHINKIAKHLDTTTYEVICSIGKRVPRIYVK